MARKWEGSAADKTADRKGARKAGMSMKAWEKSPQDKRMDAAAQKRMKGRKGK